MEPDPAEIAQVVCVVFCRDCAAGNHTVCRRDDGWIATWWGQPRCICDLLEHPRLPFPFA